WGRQVLIAPSDTSLFSPGQSFSPDHTLEANISNNVVHVRNVQTGSKMFYLPLAGAITSATFSSDNQCLAIVHGELVEVWNIWRRKIVGPPLEHAGNVFSIVFSPDDSRIVLISTERMVSMWNVTTAL